ncbi:RidA family protein [Luteococcus sanguinis]|uniref:RidA family protein n=1 Tax=Luteococcus sanguinis TaxID=174038 RepID=A0ABW1WZ42_9ACTN
MKPSERLAELGINLPPVAAPVAAYVPAKVIGTQVWTSGQLPFLDGRLGLTGRVGGTGQTTAEMAAGQARICALNALAAAADVAGGVDHIGRILKLVVFVASEPGFTAQPTVANGASELMGEIFGEAGAHVRSAVGVASLPLDAPVEVELVCELA